MAERILRDYDCCVECLTTPPTQQITKDHMIAKMMGKDHPEILRDLVMNRRNLAPLCTPDHRKVDKLKFREYRLKGVTGLVVFLAEDYPLSPNEDIQNAQRRQLHFLLNGLAEKIGSLNGDAPRVFKNDYERAQYFANLYANKLALDLSSNGC